MSEVAPLYFEWDGEHMVPLRPKLADKEYTIGERYRLGVIEERSAQSHSHFFAALQQAWLNLPEREAERFPTTEHMRKYSLIKTGFCHEKQIVCSSKAEAIRFAAFVDGMDTYALVLVKDNIVRHFTAKSQSYKSMGKEEFTRSKSAVLDYVSSLIGVTQKELAQAS